VRLVVLEMRDGASAGFNEPNLAVTLRTAFDAHRVELQDLRQLDQRPFPLNPDFASGFREREVFKFLSHTGVSAKCPENGWAISAADTTADKRWISRAEDLFPEAVKGRRCPRRRRAGAA
jgi:hypothetical protein